MRRFFGGLVVRMLCRSRRRGRRKGKMADDMLGGEERMRRRGEGCLPWGFRCLWVGAESCCCGSSAAKRRKEGKGRCRLRVFCLRWTCGACLLEGKKEKSMRACICVYANARLGARGCIRTIGSSLVYRYSSEFIQSLCPRTSPLASPVFLPTGG